MLNKICQSIFRTPRGNKGHRKGNLYKRVDRGKWKRTGEEKEKEKTDLVQIFNTLIVR